MRIATNPETGEQVYLDPQTNTWKPYKPKVGANLAQAAASGASRGMLGTLDIVPRGIAGAFNVANRMMLPSFQAPELDVAPFSRMGGLMGLGQYEPQTTGEERAAFAGEMLGASTLPAIGTASRAAAPARALVAEAAALTGATGGGLLGDVVGANLAGEQGQQAGRLAGTLAGGLSPAAAPYLARRFVSPYGAEYLRPTMEAARRQDIPITAGQAMRGSFVEKASATLPGGQRAAQTFAERQADRFQNRVEMLTRGLASREPSSEAAGRAIRTGVEEWSEAFKRRGSGLFDEVEKLVPPDTPTALTRTKQTIKELMTDDEAFSKILDSPSIRQLNEALEQADSIAYESASKLRTTLGRKLASPTLVSDLPTGEIKRIYGALSGDLMDAAKAAGPEAAAAAKRANTYWRAGHKRLDDFLEPLAKKKLPEDIYKAATAGTKEGASRLRAIKKSVSPEQWNVLVATTLRRLGRARASERTTGEIAEEAIDFSPETFLTSLQNLDVNARKALFTGNRYGPVERHVNDLMTVAQGIRGQRQMAYNPSGTTGALANIGWLAALPFLYNPANQARLVGGIAGNVGIQKAMQSPRFQQYLAEPTAFAPSGLGQATRVIEAAK